jgi:hypothetical protein
MEESIESGHHAHIMKECEAFSVSPDGDANDFSVKRRPSSIYKGIERTGFQSFSEMVWPFGRSLIRSEAGEFSRVEIPDFNL